MYKGVARLCAIRGIRVLFVKKIAIKLTPIDTNIKRRVQI